MNRRMNGPDATMTQILLGLTEMLGRHGEAMGRHGESLGRIEATQQMALQSHQTILTILATQHEQHEHGKSRTLSLITSVLGQWGTIVATLAAAWKFLTPLIRSWLGF
jgi:hypothetical protein